jgi:uncharacterized protein (TIGR02996 family)
MSERFLDNTPMTDRDALLRAIYEAPDDDAPRLIYADWLDENVDPRQAEFIRVQVEMARLPISERKESPLFVREQELWREIRRWRFLPVDWTRLGLESFQRGCVAHWHGTVADFVSGISSYWRFGPINKLRVEFDQGLRVAVSRASEVANCPVFGRLTEVMLFGSGLSDEWAISIARSPFASQWQYLHLAGPDLSDAVCDCLATSILARSNCKITLTSNAVTALGKANLENAFGERQNVFDFE